ncbi:MAG: glycosyltransferase family 39 protein [Candidatus Hydrogenedentes bacterium]|nr:glycosyltransferase family 39 protein [Candidatus Hydrogenedentota bacterium]
MKGTIINNLLRSSAFWCAMLTVALLAPFLNKAFHIDDPLFLWVAKQIHAHPLDYYGFDVNWSGHLTPMAQENMNPPLVGYYIALAACFVGWSEIPLHAAFLVPAALFALGVNVLSRRFCAQPGYATALSILSPVFLISSTSVMTDAFMTTLYVWSVVLWLKASDEDKAWLYVLAAITIVAAALSKYFAISLVPLLAAYSVASKHPVRRWLPALFLALILFGLYEWHSQSRYGGGSLLTAALYKAPDQSGTGKSLFLRTLTALSFTGGCLAGLLFVSPLLLTRRRLAIAGILAVATFLLLAVLPASKALLVNVWPWYFWPALGQLALWIVVGASVLILAANDLLHRRDPRSILLALWVAGTFIFAAYLNWSVTARTILPLVPPTVILAVRQIEITRPWFREAAWKWRTVLPLLLTAAFSLSLTRADYLLAGSARTAASGASHELASYTKHIYFLGQWGFQYYMQNAGMTPVDLDNADLSEGDIVISPNNNSNVFPLKDDHVRAKSAVELPVCRWTTPMLVRLGAGFYSDLWGPLPFAFGPVSPERYTTSLIGKPGNPFDLSFMESSQP